MKRISFRLLALTSLGAGAVGLAPRVEGSFGEPRGVPQSCDSELVEQIRIGTLTGAAEYSFSHIVSIAVGAGGRLFVADADLVSIREFDSEGRFVREIGRQGEGPGEFRSIAGVSVLPDGRLAAWDRRNRRVTVYGTDGAYDHAVRAESVTPPYPFMDRAFLTDTDGNYYLRIYAKAPSFGPDPRGIGGARYGYARISPDGVVMDTLVAPEAPGSEAGGPIVIHTPAGERSPFPVKMLDAPSPLGYLVAGFNATYAFSIPDPAGMVHVEREGLRPVDVTTGERAEWRARVAYAERRSGTSFAEVPARKPAYRDLWVDSDARIWVHRYAEALKRDEPILELWLEDPEGSTPRITWAEPSLHDVFGPDGRLLHCVVVPDDAELVASRGSVVWGIARGALAEEYVVRWRIE